MPEDFTSLFDFCPIGAYRSSPDGRVLRVNAALARINGFDHTDDLAAVVHDIGAEWYVDPERREEFKALLERDGQVVGFVSEVRRYRTRERIWVNEHAHAVRDDQGAIKFFEGTVEEITQDIRAQQDLRRSEEQLRQVTAQIPGLVYRMHVSPQGRRRFDFVSPGVRDIYGVEPAEVLDNGELLQTFTHPEDVAALRTTTSEGRRRGAPVIFEFRVLPRTGGLRWVQLTSSEVQSSEPGYTRIGMVVDITERKLAETLRAERDRADAANRATSQFLSRVSHELRTPLNAILGFAQLLDMGDEMPDQQARWVRQILASGRHLLGLVDDVLDLSAAQSGQQRLHLEAVDLQATADEAWAMLSARAQERGIAFDNRLAPMSAPWVHADRKGLRQVLSNLMSNAVKYNRAGGLVRLEARETDGRVEVDISDTGIGMNADQLSRLFNAFDRLGAQHSGVEGTGLGLALSRQLTDSMGGTIGVRSEPGVGTTFTLSLARASA